MLAESAARVGRGIGDAAKLFGQAQVDFGGGGASDFEIMASALTHGPRGQQNVKDFERAEGQAIAGAVAGRFSPLDIVARLLKHPEYSKELADRIGGEVESEVDTASREFGTALAYGLTGVARKGAAKLGREFVGLVNTHAPGVTRFVGRQFGSEPSPQPRQPDTAPQPQPAQPSAPRPLPHRGGRQPGPHLPPPVL